MVFFLISQSKDTLKQAFSDLSASINQAVFTFCSQLCQVPSIANTAGMAQRAGIAYHANTAAGTNKNATSTTGLTVLAAAANTALAETQQGDAANTTAGTSKNAAATTGLTVLAAAANTSLADGTQQGDAAANTDLPGITQHVTGAATVVTEPAVPAADNTLQATTSNVPVSNTLLETDDHSYSGRQQEVSKDCATEFADAGVGNTAQATNSNIVRERRSKRKNDTGAANTTSDSASGSTEILENPDDSSSAANTTNTTSDSAGSTEIENSDDSYSGADSAAGRSGIICEEMQFQREKGFFSNAVDVAGSSQARRDDCELNNEHIDLSHLTGGPSLHELLQSPLKKILQTIFLNQMLFFNHLSSQG